MATTNNPSAAATAFMDVPELVENMLLQLPLRKILTVQTVCKTWKDIIENSPQIQKALFFRPSQDVQLRLVETRGVFALHCTDRFKHRYSDAGNKPTDSGNSQTRWAVGLSDTNTYVIVVDPFLHHKATSPTFGNYLYRRSPFFKNQSYQYPHASWRRMLLTQPPLAEALVKSGDYRHPHWHSLEAPESIRGLTLDHACTHTKAMNTQLVAIWGESRFAEVPLSRAVGAARPADIPGRMMLEEMSRPLGEEYQGPDLDSDDEDEDEGIDVSDGPIFAPLPTLEGMGIQDPAV